MKSTQFRYIVLYKYAQPLAGFAHKAEAERFIEFVESLNTNGMKLSLVDQELEVAKDMASIEAAEAIASGIATLINAT